MKRSLMIISIVTASLFMYACAGSTGPAGAAGAAGAPGLPGEPGTVSYTHLTLPTKA